jgi:hypothetical protein
MEIDELKSAWQVLDRKISRESAIQFAFYRDRKLDQTRSSLLPLRRGQVVQLFAGAGIVLLAGLLWSKKNTDIPNIAAGIAVHLYGIVCIISAAVVLHGIREMDFSDSVLEIQSKLARVRKAYILSGLVVGQPWWFMWVPFLMVLAKLGGVNVYAHAPSVIWIGLGVGVAGILATWGLYSYSRDTSRPRLNRWVDDAITGRSLRRAQAQLEEIRRFEQE